MPGTTVSPVEVVQVTPFGVWIAYHDREFFLDHERFPWFRSAAVKDVFVVEEVAKGHFHWPDLDVDLDIDRIENPEKYPLVATDT